MGKSTGATHGARRLFRADQRGRSSVLMPLENWLKPKKPAEAGLLYPRKKVRGADGELRAI